MVANFKTFKENAGDIDYKARAKEIYDRLKVIYGQLKDAGVGERSTLRKEYITLANELKEIANKSKT